MNFLFSLDRKYILLVIIIFFLLCFIFIFYKFFFSIEKKLIFDKAISKVDITDPRFSINNFDRKILITAKEGDFINKDKILLKKNVLFKSNKFSIESDNVIFNRKDQTAESYENSIFRSNNTKISSEGFNIYDNGNKIKFHGNSVIILK